MAIPVSYVIYLTNQAQVATLQTTYPNGIQVPPNAAAAMFGVPTPSEGTNNLNLTGGIAIFPEDSVGYLPDLTPAYGTETFTVTYTDQSPPPASSGFPDPYPFTLSCFWVGWFLIQGEPGTAPPSNTPRYLGNRQWIWGGESPTLGEGNTGNARCLSRDASRTDDGIGFAFRNHNNYLVTEVSTGTNTVLWERFYIRLRTLPTGGDDNIWSAIGSGEAGRSVILNVNTTGTLQGYFKGNAAYPGQSAGTSTALTVGTWYKIDIRYEFLKSGLAGTPTMNMTVYINGTQSFTGTGTDPAANQHHANSQLGEDVSATNHGAEVDIDDWIGANEVLITNAVTGLQQKFPGNDLTSGSHVKLVRATGFGPNHQTANWTGANTAVAGDWREINALTSANTGALTGLQTTVNGATLQVTTDYVRTQNGVAAFTIGAFHYSSNGNNGTLKVNANVFTTAFTQGVWTGSPNIYSISSGATVDQLPDISPVTLTLIAPNPSGTYEVTGLFATCENIGIFGPEDSNPTTTFPPRVGIHNAPYPSQNVAQFHTTNIPISAVRVITGTYTGNNIGQDVFEKIQAHWYWVRPISGGTNDGGVWWSSMLTSHHFLPEVLYPEIATPNLVANTARIETAGSSAINNTTVTYQFIAVSDPGMRFLINGAFAHVNSLASATNALIDSAFTPDGGFFFIEDFTSGTTGHYFKGVGHTTDSASPLDGSSTTGIASLAAGTITSKQTIHTDKPQTAFSVWRRNDGSGVAQWFDMVQYTGDGTGSKTITVTLNGQTPGFVLVTPHNSNSFFRDNSHTGAHSYQINSGDSTTGITAVAANQFTVGSSLDSNGIVYDVFVIGSGNGVNGAYTAAGEVQRPTAGPWVANPSQIVVSPVTLNPNTNQWALQRFDMRTRDEARY